MQRGKVVMCGSGCPGTNSGQHHFEDGAGSDGGWWCRQCGLDIGRRLPSILIHDAVKKAIDGVSSAGEIVALTPALTRRLQEAAAQGLKDAEAVLGKLGLDVTVKRGVHPDELIATIGPALPTPDGDPLEEDGDNDADLEDELHPGHPSNYGDR